MSINQLRAHAIATGRPLRRLMAEAVREYCARHRLPDAEVEPGKRRKSRQIIAESIILNLLKKTGPMAWESLVKSIHASHPDFGQRAARLARGALQQGGAIEKRKIGKRTFWAAA